MLDRFVASVKKVFAGIMKDRKKMMFAVIALIAVIILVLLCVIFFSSDILMAGISDGERFKKEYEELNEKESEEGKNYLKIEIPLNNKMKYSNSGEILEIFNDKKDAVIYIGYPSCLYCRSAAEVLSSAASESDIDSVYYLDVEKKDNKYNELLSILDKKYTVDENGKEIYAPLVLFVVNGEIVSNNKGTLFSQDDPYVALDEYQVIGLKRIYDSGISGVVESIKLKNSVTAS